jgi:HSP20 family protein
MRYYITTRPTRRWNAEDTSSYLPLNVHEESDAYILSAPVPGLQAEDVDIQIVDDVVSIKGEFKNLDGDYLLRELPNGSFQRTLRLPAPLDAAQAEAALNAGVLTLRVPKAESARPKQIKINAK